MHSEARWAQTANQTFNISLFELGGGLPGSAWAQSAIGAPPEPISLPVGIAVAHLPHPVARARPTGAARRRAAARGGALGISAAWFFTPARSAHRRRRRPGQGPSAFGTWAGSRAWVTSSAAFWTSL
jgi:hypothetical protein